MISECTLLQSLLHVILMGKRGTSPACLSVSVYARTSLRSFAAYLAGGISTAVTLLASEEEQA